MSSIRIVSTPAGQAPEWVREKWIGIEIPLAEQEEAGTQAGVFLGKPENLDGYEVGTNDAIQSLREKSPEAADWWEKNAPLAAIVQLVFAKEVCELIP